MKSNFFILNLITNCLNNFFFQFLILYFFVTGNFSLISKIVLFVAPIVFLKDSFSSNQRTLLISDKKLSHFKIFLKKRIVYMIIIIIPYTIIFFLFNNNEEKLLIFFVVIVLMLLWLNELKLAFYENNLESKKMIQNLFCLIFLYLTIIYYDHSKDVAMLQILTGYVTLIFVTKIYGNNLKKILFSKKIFRIKKKFDFQLLSTISTNFVNLIWRIVISLSLSQDFSGVLFAMFAIASFPASFYNNTVGMTLEINTRHQLKSKFIFLFYYFLIIFLVYYIYVNEVVPLNNENFKTFFLITGFFSFLASLIMIFSSIYRIKIINYLKLKRKKLFKLDIIYSFLNLISITIIYFLLGVLYFYLLLFISSLISLVYFYYYKKNE